MVSSVNLFAQKRRNKKTVTPPTPALPNISLSDAIQQYKFDEAEELLHAQLESANEAGKNTESIEVQLLSVQKAKSQLNAVEQVTFIDSLVVPFEQVFKNIRLSEEVGQITSYDDYFKKPGSGQLSSVFLSQMKDKLYYAEKDKNGHYRLYSREQEGKTWSAPITLNGLDANDDLHQNYPFMMSDGITLYYAAQGPESIGGYDIFMTRYDTDERTFLTPDNIGMPFNSPANDYLYMVDDYLNLGWFVTDRNQTNGNVCIYTFLPNESRKIYNANTLAADKLRSYAKITRIRDTWSKKQDVDDALARLAEAKKDASSNASSKTGNKFIINDNLVYYKASDFRSADARKQYEFWQEGQKQLLSAEESLNKQRELYANESGAKKTTIGNGILKAETDLRKLIESLKQQEKTIRELELKTVK